MAPIIRAKQAAYRYPQNNYGLAPVSLTIEPGERLLVTGPSGCGKSTLARCLTSGIIAAFLGMGDFGALNTFLSYTMVGVCTDLALLLLGRNPENVVVAVLAATFGHMGKFLVKWGLGVLTGAPVGFVALGLLRALVGYVVFGALGGLLGALTLKALRRAGFFGYLAEKR